MRKIHVTRQFFEASGRHGDLIEKMQCQADFPHISSIALYFLMFSRILVLECVTPPGQTKHDRNLKPEICYTLL